MIQDEPRIGPTRSRRRLGRAPRLLLVLLGLTAVLVFGGAYWYANALGGDEGGEPVTFVVEQGATARSIAEGLEERGIIRSAFAMRLHLRFSGLEGDLKPGVYELNAGLGVDAALDQLLEGVPLETVRFTIPEGKTLGEIADIIDRNTGVTRKEFLAEAKPGKHRPRILPKGVGSLEGVLFPDTYEVQADATASEIVQALVDRFDQVIAELPMERVRKLGVTKYEAVIIASLIEREARIQKDRPLISSVIYNRLAIPMRLQIDATVQYVLFQRDGEYAEIVLFRDLEIDSPYNTYRIEGLPPTPIAVPGRAALEAALDPADTEFLYYVACGGKGGHAFGRTGGDHQRNIERCR